MRILHVIATSDPKGGGPIEGVVQRGRALREMGHSIEIATCDNPSSDWVRTSPFPIHAMGPGVSGYARAPRLKHWLTRHAHDYDGVVVNGIWQYHDYCVWKVMRSLGRPYLVFTHGMLDPWFKRAYPLKHLKKLLYWLAFEYRILRGASYVLFTTEEERLLARQSFRPYRVRERVVRYGVRSPEGDAEELRREFLNAYPELVGKRVVLFLSRIHPKKGCDLLLRAFAEVAPRDPSLHLVMSGPDQVGWQSELQALSHQHGIADRVTWTGMLVGTQKWGAFHSCEVFALPSHQENFGIVIVEALACGKPVVTTKAVNVWREVLEGGCGWIADATSPSIASALDQWLNSEASDAPDLARRARACFERNFEVNASAESLLSALAACENRVGRIA